jgi:hypothetical protein
MMSEQARLTDQILERAARDTDFRQALVSTPHSAIEAELGIAVPADLKVRVVEAGADELVLVVPAEGDTVADRDLAAASGGIEMEGCTATFGIGGTTLGVLGA